VRFWRCSSMCGLAQDEFWHCVCGELASVCIVCVEPCLLSMAYGEAPSFEDRECCFQVIILFSLFLELLCNYGLLVVLQLPELPRAVFFEVSVLTLLEKPPTLCPVSPSHHCLIKF
jgi:hypothetical protein